MLVRDKKSFLLGLMLAIGFIVLLLIIISPVFSGKNGLEYADDMFNKLAKGSSYFVPKVQESNEKFMGKQFRVTIIFDDSEEAARVTNLISTAGGKVQQKDNTLTVEGDLGKLLRVAITDSDLMYKNEGEKIKSRYGYEEKQVLKDWWQALNKINKEFQSTKNLENAKIVMEVMKKVIEPGYNFYKIEAVKVSQRAFTMTGILAFYVLYTVWWGFAILYIFEGLGITAKKAKVKKEV